MLIKILFKIMHKFDPGYQNTLSLLAKKYSHILHIQNNWEWMNLLKREQLSSKKRLSPTVCWSVWHSINKCFGLCGPCYFSKPHMLVWQLRLLTHKPQPGFERCLLLMCCCIWILGFFVFLNFIYLYHHPLSVLIWPGSDGLVGLLDNMDVI